MITLEQIYKSMKDVGYEPTEKDIALIEKAYLFAEKAHADQKRMSGEPYFYHVAEAGNNCARFGMDATVIAAGLLHDTIEDANVDCETLEKEFGNEIESIVEGVTKLGKLKYQGQERHVESLRKFFVAVAQDVRVLIVKLADRLHNLSTLQYVRKDKQKRIAIESIEIHAALASRLGMGKLAGEIQDLAFPYAYPAEYKMTHELLKHHKNVNTKYLEKIQRSLRRELAEQDVKDVHIYYRVKGIYSLYKKLLRKGMDIDQVYDAVALRVIVPSIEDCYRVLGVIHGMWRPLPGRIKDYIALQKPNGYRSLHTTIFTGDGGIVEIQIRTTEMQEFAEFGIAAHHAYKVNSLKTRKNKKKKSKSFDWLEQLRTFQKEDMRPVDFLKELRTDFFQDRIFVFTPKGDVIDLPQGSTVLDFAYAIHSDLGNHMSASKVNGKRAALSKELKSHDICYAGRK